MGRLAYAIIMAGIWVYLFQEHNAAHWVVAFFFVLGFWRGWLNLLIIGRRAPLVLEQQSANCVLRYTLYIEQVVQHPAFDGLYARLQAKGEAPTESLEEWRALLLRRFAELNPEEPRAYEVRYNFKAGMVYKNDKPEYADYIYDEIQIPYRPEKWRSRVTHTIVGETAEECISLRILVVNGALRLELGRFEEEYSPKVHKAGFMAMFDSWEPITVFPLMYFSFKHRIPSQHMNASYEATPAFKQHQISRTAVKDQFADSRAFNADLLAYRVLCDEDVYNAKLITTFNEKRDLLLQQEGYETHKRERGEPNWSRGTEYWNRYGKVFFADLKSTTNKKWFNDYYERSPV